MRRWRHRLHPLSVVLLVACSERAPTPPSAVARDSAGITVVENPRLSELPELNWTLGSEPTLEVGSLDGSPAEQFFRIQDALRLSDGRLAVVDGGSNEVRVFSAEGTHLYSWGGEGEGPGEFSGATSLLRWEGDSIAVWDRRLRRVTVFGSDGQLGASGSIPDVGGMNLPTLVGLTESGDFLVQSVMIDQTLENGLVRAPTRVTVADRDGNVVADLGTHLGDQMLMRVGEGRVEILRIPFTLSSVVAAVGAEVLIAGTERLEFHYFDVSGGVTRLVRVLEPRHPVTDADRAAALGRRLENAPEGARGPIRRSFEENAIIDTLPALSEVIVDAAARPWVQLFRSPADTGPDRWLVLAANGTAEGIVNLPAGFRVFEIGSEYVLGSFEDELGVERVQLWPLFRSDSPQLRRADQLGDLP